MLITLARAFTFIFIFTNVLFAHQQQASIWKERGQSSPQLASLAGLPAPSPLFRMTTPSSSWNVSIQDPDLDPGLRQDDGISLPPSFLSHVNIRESFKGSSWRSVILIEDVHMNLEAQKHISEAIKIFGDEKGTEKVLVGLEGANGGFIYDEFKTVPVPDIAEKVSNAFLETLDISGPAHAGFTSFHKEGTKGLNLMALMTQNSIVKTCGLTKPPLS